MISQSHELLINSKSEILRALDELDSTSMFSSQLSDAIGIVNSGNVEKLGSIVVIGCGGTGSWLLPKLIKTINDAKRKDLLTEKFKLILVDADNIEDKNLVRQNFIGPEIGINKAEVMATRYGPHLDPSIEVIYYDKYIASPNQIHEKPEEEKHFFMNIEDIFEFTANEPDYRQFDKLRAKMSCVVFNLVDNSKARQALHGFLNSVTTTTGGYAKAYSNIYAVDTGNDMYNGQYHVSSYSTNGTGMKFHKLNDFSSGCVGLNDFRWHQSSMATRIKNSNNFFDFSPETISANDDVSLYSCAEADVDIDNQDQMLVANDFAATLCHNWLISYLLSLLQTSSIVIPPSDATFICGSRSMMNSFGGIPNDVYIDMFLISKIVTFDPNMGLNSFRDTSFDKRFDRSDKVIANFGVFCGYMHQLTANNSSWYNGDDREINIKLEKFFNGQIKDKSPEEIALNIKGSAVRLLEYFEREVPQREISLRSNVLLNIRESSGISKIFVSESKDKAISDDDVIIYHIITSLLLMMRDPHERVENNIANMIVILNMIVALN